MKVLFVSEWYPHRYDAMMGLFVQKHAMAVVSQGVDVCVLYLHHDNHIRTREITDQTTNGVREIIVYYPNRYFSALRAGWKYVRKNWGMPEVCQLNVITKNALLPLWLKWCHHIPYVIVEHWTGYLTSTSAFQNSNLFHRLLSKLAARQAKAVLPVSTDLMRSMQQCGLKNNNWQVINNVVDDFFYNRPTIKRTNNIFNLLHISCFDEPHKNVCGLLRAVRQLANTRSDFVLTIVGTGLDYEQVRAYADTLKFPPNVLRWTGELTPQQVAEQFDLADAFVLFSNYENAPVVISESLATGTPIISSNVGGIAEMVPNECGCLVPAGDEEQLKRTINNMLDQHNMYNRNTIRLHGQQYSFESVGKRLVTIYKE